jgi:hypothetical protein
MVHIANHGQAEDHSSEYSYRKLLLEARSDFWDSSNQQNDIRNVLVVSQYVPQEEFSDLEETDIKELLTHAAELPEKEFEHLTVLSEADDNKDSVAVVEASTYYPFFKNGLQMADEFVDNFFCRNITPVNGEDLLY